MAIWHIPLPDRTTPFLRQRTSLSGVSYRFDFRYNQRCERWFVSLYDSDDEALLLNRMLVANWDLLYPLSDERRPAGRLICATADGLDPDLTTIETARLYWYPDG